MFSNRKFSDDIFNQFLISNGMIHIGYTARNVSDIVDHFSPEGIEIACDDFTDWFEEFLPYLPRKECVVLEVSGAEFDEKEKESIANAVWNTYHDKLARAKKQLKSDLIQEIWILLSFILSCVFLFIIRRYNLTVLQQQYVSLPFWFFGYRLLDFIILGLYPRLKDMKMFEQMASMKVFFSGLSPLNEVPKDKIEEYTTEIMNCMKDRRASDYRAIREDFLMDGDRARISFHIDSIEELVPQCNIKGYELFDKGFKECLYSVTEYLPAETELEVCFKGANFTEEEKNVARNALNNSMKFEKAHNNVLLRDNLLRVIVFLVCLLISSLILNKDINMWDTVTSEAIYMLFWFFGDYLVQYLILDPIGKLKESKKINQLKNAKLIFEK